MIYAEECNGRVNFMCCDKQLLGELGYTFYTVLLNGFKTIIGVNIKVSLKQVVVKLTVRGSRPRATSMTLSNYGGQDAACDVLNDQIVGLIEMLE